jgi:DNA-cytosine methyltransferase
MALTFGSLFAGVGGFDMGFEQAGWDCKFQVEWDKNCQQILNKHWPDVPKWLDVSDVNGAEIPPVDCIVFGSPCQDLSVAGKRAGLEGERSGLFHEAVRIIKEMRDATNGTFPRWTVWENVAGALSSNNGRDFGTVINEMAKAGAHLQEYALLDAQHFGIPQRRRRVFLISCFDSATADRCPDPLLPVTESVRGDSKKGKQKRKEPASQVAESFGSDGQWAAGSTEGGDILRTSVTSKWHKGSGGPSGSEYYNMVVEDQDVVGTLAARDYKGVGNQYVAENKCVVEPYVKSRRAQTADDDETWVSGEVNPTLNSFDVGDTRATTAIVEPVLFENSYRDGARIANDGVTQTLSAKMGTGGGNTPMIAIPIQDGREIEKHQNGFGVSTDGEPSYTLDQTGAQAVAYSVREDAKANTFSATELDHANALSALRPSPQSHHAQMFITEQVSFYDGYNQKLDDSGVYRSLRIGRDSSDFIAQPVDEPTVFQPGTMVRLGGGVWEGTVPTLRAEAKRGDNEPHLAIHGGEPMMAVRRLTPLECERLMGWPDDHTRHKADGTEQADTHRYKQCGNGVASPVAKWVAEHIARVEYAEG